MRILFALAALALGSGCGGVGSCVASGGIVDECKEDWTEAECQEFDDQQVNGASWSLEDGTCEELGFAATCSDGSHVRSSSDC